MAIKYWYIVRFSDHVGLIDPWRMQDRVSMEHSYLLDGKQVVPIADVLAKPEVINDAEGKPVVTDEGRKHGIYVGDNGKLFQRAKPHESQFLESRQFALVDVARLYGLPPHKLQDLTVHEPVTDEPFKPFVKAGDELIVIDRGVSIRFIISRSFPEFNEKAYWPVDVGIEMILSQSPATVMEQVYLSVESGFAKGVESKRLKTRTAYYQASIQHGVLTRDDIHKMEQEQQEQQRKTRIAEATPDEVASWVETDLEARDLARLVVGAKGHLFSPEERDTLKGLWNKITGH